MTIWEKILFKYYDIVPYEFRPSNLWYTFKCWAWKRYTTIKPRTLGHDWCDRSHLLPHVMFEVLCQFVEQELLNENSMVDWDAYEDHAYARDEMLGLYRWWTEEYDVDYPWNIELTNPRDYLKLENKQQDKLLKNCKRLVDISPFMWT